MPPTGHFDLMASFYDRIFGPPDPAHLRVLLDLPTSGWLLDVGGETGRVAQTLRGQVGQVVILDNSAGMLQRAITKGLAAVQGEAERLPFPDDCFNRIVVVDALHHFRHQTQVARELLRVLSPQGLLVIEEPNVKRWAVKMVALAEKIALMGSRFSGMETVTNLFHKWGGKVVISKEEGFYFWLAIEKKDMPNQ